MWVYSIIGSLVAYLLLTLIFTYLVHQYPRNPVTDIPDWGRVIDACIPTVDGGSLEVWQVEPKGPSRGVVLLAHGWSRNRARMVSRARIFGDMGPRWIHPPPLHECLSFCRGCGVRTEMD